MKSADHCCQLRLVRIGNTSAMVLAMLWPTGTRRASAAEAPSPPDAIRSMRPALREMDRFLDHHPLLEESLRIAPEKIFDRAILRDNPDLESFLRANPDVLPALRFYPRYYLYRGLLRQACIPLSFAELADLRVLFQAKPEIAEALNKNPALIRDPAFLRQHEPLREFLSQHATLGHAFLRSESLTPPKP